MFPHLSAQLAAQPKEVVGSGAAAGVREGNALTEE